MLSLRLGDRDGSYGWSGLRRGRLRDGGDGGGLGVGGEFEVVVGGFGAGWGAHFGYMWIDAAF